MNWNQKQLKNFLARPYIYKSLATIKKLPQADAPKSLGKKVSLFHQKPKDLSENLAPATLFSFSLKKKRAAKLRTNGKNWKLPLRCAISKTRFRRQFFLKYQGLLLPHPKSVTKFPLRLTKTRKISRFFLKQSRFLFEKKKKKINLTTFNKTGKKKTFSSYKKKRKILFAGHPRKAFWRIRLRRFKAIKRRYKKKFYKIRKRKKWEESKTFWKSKLTNRELKGAVIKKMWEAMVPNRKKRYYFFEKKPKGYPRKRSKKKRLFFREHRRIRRHPLGYVGMAHFFSKEKDLFQLHKAKRFFFQQTLGSNIYQNWAQTFEKSKLQSNYWWVCSNQQVPLLFQKKERVFRRCVFFNNKDKLLGKTHLYFELQKKKRLFLRKNLEIFRKVKKPIVPASFFTNFTPFFENKKKQVNLPVIKKINSPLYSKNIKLPMLFGKNKISFLNSAPFRRVLIRSPEQLPPTRFFSNLAWKFVEKRKKTKWKKVKQGKKKETAVMSPSSSFNVSPTASQKKKIFTKPGKILGKTSFRAGKKAWAKKRFKLRFVKFKPRGSRRLLRNIKVRKKKKKTVLVFNKSFKKKKFRFRRRGHRNWKFRFPRWKTYYRNLWRYGHNNKKTKWIRSELYSYRLYRRKHQIYRIKNPRKAKANKWLLRLESSFKRHVVRTRYKRLVNRLMHFKLFSKFYGPFTSKKVSNWGKRFQKINPWNFGRKTMALAWFDRRIAITVYRLGLAPSLKVAQLLVKKGYIFVNGQQIVNEHHHLALWDVVSITPYFALADYYLWYWWIRNKYKRHAFKKKNGHHKALSSNRLTYPFGFWINASKERDLPRTDRIQAKEFERLLLSKYFI